MYIQHMDSCSSVYSVKMKMPAHLTPTQTQPLLHTHSFTNTHTREQTYKTWTKICIYCYCAEADAVGAMSYDIKKILNLI